MGNAVEVSRLPLGLVLATGLLWAACDFARKKALALHSRATVQRACALGQAGLALVLFAFGSHALPAAAYWPSGLGSALMSAAGTYCFLAALAAAPMSITIPLLALTPAFTTVAAWLLLGQRLGTAARVGLGVVLLGSWVTNPIHKAKPSEVKAFAYMTATAVLWSLASTLDARSVKYASVPVHALLCSGVTIAASYLGREPTTTAVAKTRSPWLLTCMLFCAAAAIAQWYAVRAAHAGIVEGTKRAIGTLAALGLGALLLHERISKRRAVGAFTLLAGALLLAWDVQ
jgi:drug/metabolite transporter (DMT)-like permease